MTTYDFVVYPSKKKMAWMFLISVIFVGIAVSEETGFLRGATIFFFGLCGLLFLSKLLNPSPSIIINEHGVQVITFYGATLRWSEIADVRIEEYQKNRFLTIFLTNPEIVMKRLSLWGRVVTKFNASIMGMPPAFFISGSLVDMPLEHLIGEMTSRMPRK